MNEKKHRTIALARKHIADQRVRIERHRELIDEMEKAESASPVSMRSARQHLKEMMNSLDRMLAEHRTLQPELYSPHQAEKTESPNLHDGAEESGD